MRTTSRSIALTAAALLTSTVMAIAGQPAAAAPATDPVPARIAGLGTTATARTVNAAISTTDTGPAQTAPAATARRGAIPLPIRDSGTARKPVPAAQSIAGGPNTVAGGTHAGIQTAPAIVANFDGINQASGCGGCQPPDVNAAIGVSQVVEAVNLRFQVTNKTGGVLCSFALGTFLGTSDALSDPRVEYDNLNARFIFVLTVVPASTTAAPAIWLGATTSDNACGSWFIYRPTFSGGSFPAGTLLDYPIMGQDRNAMLIGTDNFTPTSRNRTVFGVPKSAIYTGAGFSFSAFNTNALCAPVSNGGIPMIATTFSYFLCSVPGTGYLFYRLTNSGGPGATLTLQATVASAFSAPSRQINQPGTTVKLDPLDGRIVWSPVNDGNFIWFAHGIDLAGFPAVRYGAISIAANTATVAVAFRSGTSDDFNPSVGVGNSPTGGNFIYVNWAYTDTANNVAVSDTVDSVAPGAGVPNLIGTGAVIVTGSPTTEFRFGDYSSVAIDPVNANGSCALAAQQYFAPGGQWRTRLARVGVC